MRIVHVSDLHFGKPYNRPVIEGLETYLENTTCDVVVVSGDLAQRSLSGELQRGAKFIRDAERVAPVFVVPGNHDVAWWMSPMHLLGSDGLYARYRKYVREDLEPVLDVPGARFVGINTAHGLAHWTLSTRLRDLTIVGAVTREQLERTAGRLAAVPTGSARVVVMHHNPLRGDLSNRFGIVRPGPVMESLAGAGTDLILCGHDHQQDVRQATAAGRKVLVCIAGTLSDRSRGGRPCSFHVIDIQPTSMSVTTRSWEQASGTFEPLEERCFARS